MGMVTTIKQLVFSQGNTVPLFEDIKEVKIVFSVQEEFVVGYELKTEKLSPILSLPSTYIKG